MAPASSSSPGHIGHRAPINHDRQGRHTAISSMKLYTHVHMFGEIRIKAEDGLRSRMVDHGSLGICHEARTVQ